MKRHRMPPPGDDGFTLIELLVTIVLIGVVVAAIATGFIVTSKNTTASANTLERSHDAQLLANYIVADAQNTSGSNISMSDTTTCVSGGSGLSPIVRMKWTATSSTFGTTTKNVNYVKRGNIVYRLTCDGTSSPWSNVASNLVGDDISSATAVCTPSASCTSTSTGVSVTANETVPTGDTSAAYTYTLNATFRTVYAAGTPPTGLNPAGWPLIALGSGTCVNMQGNGVINLPNNSGIAANCSGAMLGSNSGILPATTNVYAVGTCSPSGSSRCAVWHSGSNPVTDPYFALPAPSTSGLTARAGCAGGSALPGLYAATLVLTANCSLTSGTYVFQAGIKLSGGGGGGGGGGIALSSAAGASVLLYFTGPIPASLLTGGSSACASGTYTTALCETGQASIQIAPMASGTYSGFSVFVDRSQNTQFYVAGQGGFTGFGGASAGIVYMPSAAVTVAGNGTVVHASQLIVNSLVCPGNCNINLN